MASPFNLEALRQKLPTGTSEEEKQQRNELFKAFDPNGNGYLSLAEVDRGCRDVIGLYEIFDAKSVIMRAFQGAKSANDKNNKPGSHGPDYIERVEFRLLLVYLREYFEIWQMFTDVHSTADHRISLEDFVAAAPKLERWGAIVSDPETEFKKIDKNGGGMILFDEFAEWALAKHLDLESNDD